MDKNLAEDFATSLVDLTVNSKPLINMLTMLAEDYRAHAPSIVKTVEDHLKKVRGDVKLPILYLIDSIVKNVGKEYVALFTQNIVSTFCSVFEQVDEKTRSQMFKLRLTWNDVFPSKKLFALDARVNTIDPAWPITAPPPPRLIHVNPKFLNVPTAESNVTVGLSSNIPGTLSTITDTAMREELLKKQKELLELQKRKVELELLQTKAILEEQQKKLEHQTATLISDTPELPKPINIPQPLPKQRVVHPDIPSSSKTKLEIKPDKTDKSKFEGAKRRDPRLARKANEARLNSRREAQNLQLESGKIPTRQSSSKVPVVIKDISREEGKSHVSNESKKNTDSSSTSSGSSSRHSQKKKSREDRYRKNKEHKPRLKNLFGDSPENRDSENSLSSPKKSASKQNNTSTKRGLASSDTSSETTSRVGLKQDLPPEHISVDTSSQETLKVVSESKEETQNKLIEKFEPPRESEIPAPEKPDEPPVVCQEVVDLTDSTPLTPNPEPIPMEIDEKPMDEVEPKPLPNPEPVPVVFKIDEPPILKSLMETDAKIFPLDSQTSDLPAANACGDTDLRLLPPQSTTDPDQPPEKKAKSSDVQLFGVEDVDLRKTLVPIPPPPPIISKSDLKHSEGWANFKRSNSDRGNSGKSPKKRKSVASSPRSSCFRKKDDDIMVGQDSMDGSEDRPNSLMLIMKEAEEQLKNETITYAQYNQMLKGVMSMNEENKLQEALMKDDYERIDSPESDINSDSEATTSEPVDSRNRLAGAEKVPGSEDVADSQKSSNDSVDHENSNSDHDGRRRSRFKNHDPYNRSKGSRHGRYFNQNETQFVSENKPWMSRQQSGGFGHRSRKDMGQGRWVGQFGPSRQKPMEYAVAPLNSRMRPPRHHPEVSLPLADPAVLDLIDSDPMTYVTVNNSAREVRFYGENAIIMMDWDDPRDLMFQQGSRRVLIDGKDAINLQFNAPYREFTLYYGQRIRIRLGAPTRELFIDGRFYEIKFGGPPIEVNLGGRIHLIQLEGPLPYLHVGTIKRTDLVAGKVNLIVDGKFENRFPIYLDAKPQRFEINGVPFIIRFVEALQTVVINGQPLKIEFGGIPVPIFFRGERHFLRLTTLPPNITPGYVNILNMEGGRISSPPPPPRIPPPPPIISDVPPMGPPSFMNQPNSFEYTASTQPSFTPTPSFPQYTVSTSSSADKPVDLLTSLLPAPTPAMFGLQTYQVDPYQQDALPPVKVAPSVPPSGNPLVNPSIDVIELYQKLVAMGVVPQKKDKDKDKVKEEPEDKEAIKPVDFSKPETLKVKQPGLISVLYSGIQCSSCGVRFSPEQTVKYSQHLDWHFRQNRRERNSTRIAQSRRWNYDVSDWIQYQEIEDVEDRAQSWFEIQDKKSAGEEEEEASESSVPAKGFGENPCCTVCRDKFDQFFNEDKEEWQLKRAVCVDEKLYHPLCLKDEQESQGRNVVPVMMPVPEDEPIETIDLEEAGESGEEEKNNIDTIEIESSSKSPEEMDEKPEAVSTEPEAEDAKPETEEEAASEEKPMEEENEKLEEEVTPDAQEKEEEKMDTEEKPREEKDKKEDEKMDVAEDSDDDILEIEVIEPHIETYDILEDDDDELEADRDRNADNSDPNEEKKEEKNENEEEIKTDIVIKTEPIDLVNPNPIANSTHINETIYLDGNSEFSAPKINLPKKIKINISSVLSKQSTEETHSSTSVIVHDENSTDNTMTYDYTEPLPPGEEPLFTGHIKPKLIGTRMTDMPPVCKGKEMSGLCSIM